VKGAVVKPDIDANTAVYGKPVDAAALLKEGSVPPPPIFKPFMAELNKYSKR
jgi:lipid-binding SYLF domain-containing protein